MPNLGPRTLCVSGICTPCGFASTFRTARGRKGYAASVESHDPGMDVSGAQASSPRDRTQQHWCQALAFREGRNRHVILTRHTLVRFAGALRRYAWDGHVSRSGYATAAGSDRRRGPATIERRMRAMGLGGSRAARRLSEEGPTSKRNRAMRGSLRKPSGQHFALTRFSPRLAVTLRAGAEEGRPLRRPLYLRSFAPLSDELAASRRPSPPDPQAKRTKGRCFTMATTRPPVTHLRMPCASAVRERLNVGEAPWQRTSALAGSTGPASAEASSRVRARSFRMDGGTRRLSSVLRQRGGCSGGRCGHRKTSGC